MILSTKNLFLKFICVTSFVVGSLQELNAQVNQCPSCWVPIYRHRLVANVNISTNVNGYAELLPKDYNPNSTKKHPIIINMHGRGGAGPGDDPYWLCLAICEGLPLKIEDTLVNDFETVNGQTYSFIVLTPQYSEPNGNWTDLLGMINYAVANYPKADKSRIYLTGNSKGSSIILDYMSSSSANAKRIAAITPLATCNSSNSNGVNNIVSNGVRYWGLTSVQDNVCTPNNTIGWANAIIAASPQGNPFGRLTVTPVYNPSFNHDIIKVWESSWTENGKTILEWMLQFTSSAAGSLPATLGNYEVILKDKQVITRWTTTLESNTDYFIIERAGPDQRFKEIGRVKASGNSSNPINYSFTDNTEVVKGTSLYRLVLVNLDGVKEYYDIKKIVGKQFGATISISPVPASKSLQLAFELEKAQRLNFIIRDINGKTIQSWAGNFSSGYLNMPISIEGFTSGIYYFVIQGENFSETKKFIKQ